MSGIERVRIQGFGCVEDVGLELGPLQAFIGPNDSGKSTILRAVALVVEAVLYKDSEKLTQLRGGLRPDGMIDAQIAEATIRLQHASAHGGLLWTFVGSGGGMHGPRGGIRSALRHGTALIRLDPDALRAPSQLIPEGQELRFFSDRGTGLAGLFDALMGRSDRPVDAITERIRQRFPTVKHIGLRNASTTHKELQIELVDGTRVPAARASEGLLYYLALAALPYLHRDAGILLLEEPENGLHPARIRDVVATLREISRTTQVLIATHSPVLVGELRPHEVFVTTRDLKTGTHVTRLEELPHLAEQTSGVDLGELWGAIVDGEPR